MMCAMSAGRLELAIVGVIKKKGPLRAPKREALRLLSVVVVGIRGKDHQTSVNRKRF